MSHTHFLFHIVFATKDRAEAWESEMHRYLGGIVKNLKGVPIEINGMPDHVHLLVRLGPTIQFSTFMRELKASSSKWGKQKQPGFSWQRRYGAFTVSESASDAVRRYIRAQKRHHSEQTFGDEYMILLKKRKIDFDENYLWD